MKRLAIVLFISTLFVALLATSGNDQWRSGALEVASINPHGNYSTSTDSCMVCHRPHGQVVNPEAACWECHPNQKTHLTQACTTCHEPHAVTDNTALIQETIYQKPVDFNGHNYEDVPTGICYNCHTTTRYHGSGATNSHYENQDCTKCHPHGAGFDFSPINCGVCHGNPPSSGAHDRHDEKDINAECSECHQQVNFYNSRSHANGNTSFNDGKRFGDTAVCDDCHGNATGISEAKSTWKSSGPIADCTGCHNTPEPGKLHGNTAPAVDQYWETNGHGAGVGLDCQGCHNPNAPHFEDAYNPRLWAPPNELCARCHADPEKAGTDVSAHGNEGYGASTHRPFVEQCDTCHDPHGSSNLHAVQSVIRGKVVNFTARTGDNSFDEPDRNNDDDLCATCHNNTSHNRNPSNWPDVTHFEGGDCTLCHKHESDGDPNTADAFIPQGSCTTCHSDATDNGDGVPPSGRPPVTDDFDKNTHHVLGTLTDDKCIVCHDQSTHGDGYIDLRMPDGGTSLRFIHANQADLTPFCQDCHDDDGSQKAFIPGGNNRDPFLEGSNLPAMDQTTTHSNEAFHDAIEDPFRTTCNQCHVGHGSDNLSIIQPVINGYDITFLSRTGKDSFDDPNKDDQYDLCATCHVGQTTLFPGGDHRPAGGQDLRGTDCTTCHRHDADNLLSTEDAFMPSCTACHGSPPPPAGYPSYGLDENLTPHQKHAGDGDGEYGIECSTCHDTSNPAYTGHVTEPLSFQDVFFDGLNPNGSYDRSNRTCATVGCHSNGSPSTGQVEFRTPSWDENSTLTCSGCHGDQFDLRTGSHARHLTPLLRDRGADAIGCFECHADTAQNNNNDGIADLDKHVDFQKQVEMDLTDLWGVPGQGSFNSGDLTCANSLCHSDGAASREQPGQPVYVTPTWGNGASGMCTTCHAVAPDQLTSGSHARHFDSSDQGPGISSCDTCHSGYVSENHVNGKVEFADGRTLSQTNTCDTCHSPGGAVDGVAEARQKWSSSNPVSCEGCHDGQPSSVKGVSAPDIAGDGSYGFDITGHGRQGIGLQCTVCHQKASESIHFDGIADSYIADADNFQQAKWLTFGGLNIPITASESYQSSNYAQCFACHSESDRVGLADGWSNALFTHSNPPPAGYPLTVNQVATRFRNQRPEGFNFGNVPANIHWDHLDMNQLNWDSDGNGAKDSKPSCATCHDPHGVKSTANGVAYPAMTYADMGIIHNQDGIGAFGEVTDNTYTLRCDTCHPSTGIKYYQNE